MKELKNIQNEVWKPHSLDVKEMLTRDENEDQFDLPEIWCFDFEKEHKILVFILKEKSKKKVNIYDFKFWFL
jgi:hypothetical protein